MYFLGPAVQIYAAFHPVLASERIKGPELASARHNRRQCLDRRGQYYLCGITIGSNTTIGAGSVVVKDIPCGCSGRWQPLQGDQESMIGIVNYRSY